jgi:hypothetical protein
MSPMKPAPRPQGAVIILACTFLLAGALVSLTAADADAVAIIEADSDPRAFSPNGDGSQDSALLSVLVDGETALVDTLFLGIYGAATLPPDPADLLAWPVSVGEEPSGDFELTRHYDWFGRAAGDTPADPLLPDGFYYLHAWAVADGDSVWLDQPFELELNTAGPSFHSLSLEPSGFFTPAQTDADNMLQVFFNSTDFDTLTDFGSARVFYDDLDVGTFIEVAQLQRDLDYHLLHEGVNRFRLLWNGEDGGGVMRDGRYRIDIKIGDYAGNPSSTASLYSNLDDLPPELLVAVFGDSLETPTLNFTIRPEALPESLVVVATDRNGLLSCFAALDSAVTFDQTGRLLPWSGFEHSFFSFDIPDYWGSAEDSLNSHRFHFDAFDLAGNSNQDLTGATVVTINLDGDAPPQPIWETTQTEYLQRVVTLSGHCEDFGVMVEILVDGELYATFPTDGEFRFNAVVDMEDANFFPAAAHSNSWTAIGLDGAGNRSQPSTELVVSYSPDPAMAIPGRLRGLPGESIQINTDRETRGILIRVYGLDGELHRSLDLVGEGRQFAVEWDLKDDAGRFLLDGLYILNLATTYADGEVEFDRKVVAIVRD